MGGICNQLSVAQWRKLWDSNQTINQGQWFELCIWGMDNVHRNGNWSEDNRKKGKGEREEEEINLPVMFCFHTPRKAMPLFLNHTLKDKNPFLDS